MAQRGKSRISLSNIIIILILVLTVIGLIVKTEEGYLEDSYILHIVFVNINKKTRNRIFSKVYDYLY